MSQILMENCGVIEVMFMDMVMVVFLAMVSHIIEVLSLCWSGVVSDHGLAQGLGCD